MKDIVKYLTTINPPRNFKNISSLNKIANFIAMQFRKIGLNVYFQTFEVRGKMYKNVIASFNTQYEKRFVFGGHYDVAGDIAGADDNATAIAGIIQTARKLYKHKDKFNFRVEFVAFTLEEPPFFRTQNMGSYQYVKFLKKNNIDVIGMVNYEMIGYFSDEENSQDYPINEMKKKYPTKGNFIAFVSNESSKKLLNNLKLKPNDLPFYKIVLPNFLTEFTASDHLNFWDNDYPAIMVTDTAFYRNPNYHKKSDTIDTLNFKKMEEVIELVVNGFMKYSKDLN